MKWPQSFQKDNPQSPSQFLLEGIGGEGRIRTYGPGGRTAAIRLLRLQPLSHLSASLLEKNCVLLLVYFKAASLTARRIVFDSSALVAAPSVNHFEFSEPGRKI